MQRHRQPLPQEILFTAVARCDLLTISSINSVPAALMGPTASKATGTKLYLVISLEYFWSFFDAAASAAEPAAEIDELPLLAASVLCPWQ